MEKADESGRTIHKGVLNVMWNGRWVPLGQAEFLEEDGRIVKVLSYTPREFRNDGASTPTAPLLCPLSVEGLQNHWSSREDFMAIYNQGPPLVEDLGPGYYRPWVDGIDPRFENV